MPVKSEAGPGRKKLDNILNGVVNKEGKVGWFESAKYPDGTPVAYVASIQEFGSGSIPPRSFMRSTAAHKRDEWKDNMKKGADAIANGGETMSSVMEKVGLGAAGDIRKTIATLTEPPLKQATINARLSKMADGKTVGNLDKPLVETGHMLNTLTNTVE